MVAENPREYTERSEEKSSGIGIPGLTIAALAIGALGGRRTRAAMANMASGARDIGVGLASLTARSTSRLAKQYGVGEKLGTAGAFLGAFHEAVDSRSPLSHLLNPTRFDNRFERGFQRRMGEVSRRQESTMGGRATKIEDDLVELLANRRGLNSLMHGRSVGFQQIMQDLEQRMPEHFNDGLRTILTHQDDKFFSDPTPDKVRGLLNRYTKEEAEKRGREHHIAVPRDGKADEAFIRDMFESLNAFKDARETQNKLHMRIGSKEFGKLDNGVNDLNGRPIQGARQQRDQFYEDFKKNHEVNENHWRNKMMANLGYRQATVDDFLKHGLFDSDEKVGRKFGGRVNARTGRKLQQLSQYDETIKQLAVDPYIFINHRGETMNMQGMAKGTHNTLSAIQRNFQVPYLRFNPLDLAHWSTHQGIKEAPDFYYFRRGTITPFLRNVERTAHPLSHNQDAKVGPLAKDYVYSGGKVFDVETGHMVDEGLYLASGRFGMMPRAAAAMGNLHTQDYRNWGFFGKLFGVGKQETESIYSRAMSVVTKYGNEDWEPNTLSRLANAAPEYQSVEYREKAYKNIYNFINQRTAPLSDDVASYLNREAQRAYGDIGIDLTKLNTNEEILDAFSRIVEARGKPGSGLITSPHLSELIDDTWTKYHNNSTDFLRDKRIVTDSAPFLNGAVDVYDMHNTELVDKITDVKRLIHQHAIEQIETRNRVNVGTLIRNGIQDGTLDNEAIKEVSHIKSLNGLQGYWEHVYHGSSEDKTAALEEFALKATDGNNPATQALMSTIKDHSPWWAMGPGQPPPQYFGLVGNIPIRKAKGLNWMIENANKQIEQGVNPIIANIKSAAEVLGQPFAGRHNLDKVTTATMPFYYGAERLDNALAKVGLGLAQKHRGSMQSILFNQFGRRVVLPYMALQQLAWADDTTFNVGSEKLADTYVNMRKDVAWAKDLTGITNWQKNLVDLVPGLDQLGQTPLGLMADWATFGLIGDTRSEDELDKYYREGTDPVRKGRWWGIGSNTPFEGGQIDYFQPNWYRRLKSHYEYTDTMYGSAGEYWANNWMPTLTHPFSPLKHFLLDTRHWENKHAEDRPYGTTGGISELQMIPLVGPLLDNTVGQILKPHYDNPELKRAHYQYLEETNKYIQSQYEAASNGGYIQFMPSGGHHIMAADSPTGEGFNSEGGIGFGYGAGGEVYAADEDGSGYGGETGSGYYDVGRVSMSNLAAINAGFTKGVGPGAGNAVRLSSLDSLRDPDMQANLADIGSKTSFLNTANSSLYDLTEMAGIYGFGFNSLFGYGGSTGQMRLADSSDMTSYNRAFWDRNLGGMDFVFGGDLSEIFRRYVPRDMDKQKWNPIRNTQPNWMPGLDYYTDFQHGDPYTKVANGEYRLPGEAYESMHKLHPDAFGEYGAFDRFRILADVAPYSQEYKYWRKMVSQMNQAGMMDEEMKDQYAEVRDQVTKRKKKYHFYNNRFRNADIEKQEVTVTRILDQNTFLTAEYPNHPFKLAGIKIKADDMEAQEMLSQYLKEGSKVTVGLDKDPLTRVRDDMMTTMRVVLYSNGGDESYFPTSSVGQSVNAMIANRKFGSIAGFGGHNNVRITNDGTSTETAALFDPADITVGKLAEFITHDVFPNIPVAGVLFDKFMQVRSPLEAYKDNEVYGKSWKPWTDVWGSWIKPMFEKASQLNPLLAAAQGYGTGWLFGRPGTAGRFYGKWAGAIAFGATAALRVLDETAGNMLPKGSNGAYKWIPERRQKEREINEYFDVLKYMKYKGLYERAKEDVKEQEGIDLDQLLGDNDQRGGKNKAARQYLAEQKKWLNMYKKLGYADDGIVDEKLTKINEKLSTIDGDKSLEKIGPYAMQALQYRNEYESTLYGADPNGDMTQIFRALPSKDREFFTEFMTATPSEREEILSVVPENERRFYQAKWGMKMDKRRSLDSYFMAHNLPGTNWEGWRPDVNLDDIKVKVVRNEGIEATEFGLWGDDEKRADQSGVSSIDISRPSMHIDPMRIEKILRGAGLGDVRVTMDVAPAKGPSKIGIAMDYMKDRSHDIMNEINDNLHTLI